LPSYCPQLLHAVCGNFISPHARFGHGTRVGALVFHCERRARVLLRDIFRFGTATSLLLTSRSDRVVQGLLRLAPLRP
jgi:hypothetical protein